MNNTRTEISFSVPIRSIHWYNFKKRRDKKKQVSTNRKKISRLEVHYLGRTKKMNAYKANFVENQVVQQFLNKKIFYKNSLNRVLLLSRKSIRYTVSRHCNRTSMKTIGLAKEGRS